MAISLDPTSIREEAADRITNGVTSEDEDLSIIERLSDEQIDVAIDNALNDSFWEVFDGVRSTVISRLCHEHGNAPPMLQIGGA